MNIMRSLKQFCKGCKKSLPLVHFDLKQDRTFYKKCRICRGGNELILTVESIEERFRKMTKIICECGVEICRSSLRRHLNTVRHNEYIIMLNE